MMNANGLRVLTLTVTKFYSLYGTVYYVPRDRVSAIALATADLSREVRGLAIFRRSELFSVTHHHRYWQCKLYLSPFGSQSSKLPARRRPALAVDCSSLGVRLRSQVSRAANLFLTLWQAAVTGSDGATASDSASLARPSHWQCVVPRLRLSDNTACTGRQALAVVQHFAWA